MTFDEYVKKPEFIEIAQKRAKTYQIIKKLVLFVLFPLIIVGAILAILGEVYEWFHGVGTPVRVALIATECSLLSSVLILFLMEREFAKFSKQLFTAERLFVAEKLAPLFEKMPKEGDCTLYYDQIPEGQEVRFSFDQIEWTVVDFSQFLGSVQESDLRAMLLMGYFPKMYKDGESGLALSNFEFSPPMLADKRRRDGYEMHRVVKNGKLTRGAIAAHRRYVELCEWEKEQLLK